MSDKSIGDAAEATASEGGAVILVPNPEAEAREAERPDLVAEHAAQLGDHETRLRILEASVQGVQAEHVTIRTDLAGRAMAEHDHPTDEDVRIIAEELRSLREEETAPRRPGLVPVSRGWLRRKLRGSGA